MYLRQQRADIKTNTAEIRSTNAHMPGYCICIGKRPPELKWNGEGFAAPAGPLIGERKPRRGETPTLAPSRETECDFLVRMQVMMKNEN
jgi:hypothetical protein